MAGTEESKKEDSSSKEAVDDQDVEKLVQEVVDGTTTTTPASPALTATGKKKRLCRYPGCTKVIKSQGHCQRHGAKAKRCKVEGCEKQAQGTHEGMCKRHWKAVHCPGPPPKEEDVPPKPEGESVYDTILAASVSFRPVSATILRAAKKAEDESKKPPAEAAAADANNSSDSDIGKPGTIMPLVTHLRNGHTKPPGWHRNEERLARGAFPPASLSSQLEPWERQLALFEVFLLSGGVIEANFADLAHAWGREKGFHLLLVQNACERRGEVERKKRSDFGKTMTEAERENFRAKLKKARTSKTETEKEGEQQEEEAAEPLKPASVEEMAVDQVSV